MLPKTGYDRDGDFGNAWKDVDRNGCDTRNDVLARDLTEIAKSGPCKVMTGMLVSPYTGATIDFVRGQDTSALVQIDHLVALSNAWQTGAQQLTQAQREALANDPLNLLAVDGRSNMQKGDGDAATWLPAQKSIRCSYVARQVSVKSVYGLWVTQAEHDAIERILDTCPGQAAYPAIVGLLAGGLSALRSMCAQRAGIADGPAQPDASSHCRTRSRRVAEQVESSGSDSAPRARR